MGILGLILIALPAAGGPEELAVIGLNVESGGADPAVIVEDVMLSPESPSADIWGFSEVLPTSEDDLFGLCGEPTISWARQFECAAEQRPSSSNADYRWILGRTGGDDRLMILYNGTRLQLLGQEELYFAQLGQFGRAPLVASFRVRTTGQVFAFLVNHLFRGNDAARHDQADVLNQWIEGQRLPLIAAGDYNFDWRVMGGDESHDTGYDLLTYRELFRWVRPKSLVRTQCDAFFDSVLDFVFVANGAEQWPAESEILFPAEEYCQSDPSGLPDHRPLFARFELSPVEPPPENVPAIGEGVLAAQLVAALLLLLLLLRRPPGASRRENAGHGRPE